MFRRLAHALRTSTHQEAVTPSGLSRRSRSAADSALVSRHGQDLLIGLRHQV